MSRRVILVLLIFVALVSVCYAAVPTRHFRIRAKLNGGDTGFVQIYEKKLELDGPTLVEDFRDKDGQLDIKDSDDGWFVLGTKIKSSVGGGYLAYDATGKDNKVFLAHDAEDIGTEWTIRVSEGSKGKRNTAQWATLQAANGPLKGHYFDIEQIETKQKDGSIRRSRRFLLREKPVWTVEVGRVVIHL